MADPRAFVSFDFDNNEHYRNLFCGQAKNSRTPFRIEDWSSKAVLPQREWQNRIRSKVNCCHMLIVLVGRSTYTATGVALEIQFAKEQNVPVFGVYVDGAGFTTPLPNGLYRALVISWDWESIASAIDTAMKKGKNILQ